MTALIDRIRTASRRPASLGSTPHGAISLAMGEPFFRTPAPIVAAAIEGLRLGLTRYERLTGSASLREAVAAHLSDDSCRTLDPGQVVITHGASAGLAATILALVNPGDRVLVPEPTYSLYADHVAMAGGQTVWIANRPDGSLDLDHIERELPHARLIVVCNPSNPTGYVLDRTELSMLAGLVQRTGAYLLCDEAYSDIVFDGEFCSSLGLDADRVVCCGTFSKTYAMTGWRLGYVVAPEPVADAVNLVHRTLNGAVNTFVQHAAHAALPLRRTLARDFVAEYRLRRDLVAEELAAVPGVHCTPPRGAFYVFPRIETELSSDALTARLADAGVLVRSGTEYGPSGEGHIRISYATDLDNLTEALRRLTAVLRCHTST